MTTTITWPSDPSHVESVRVVHFEVVLHDRPLHLPRPVDGREEVFGIDLIFHLLVSGMKQKHAVRACSGEFRRRSEKKVAPAKSGQLIA